MHVKRQVWSSGLKRCEEVGRGVVSEQKLWENDGRE